MGRMGLVALDQLCNHLSPGRGFVFWTESRPQLSAEPSQLFEKQPVCFHSLQESRQPKLELATNRLSGVEALLRWTSAELGVVTPAKFIPLAEETGQIIPIGKWVLRTACSQLMAWQRAGLPSVHVAVNLSPRQLSDPNLVDDVRAVLGETGMPAEGGEAISAAEW